MTDQEAVCAAGLIIVRINADAAMLVEPDDLHAWIVRRAAVRLDDHTKRG